MKVYLKTGRRDHRMFITPGTESDCSDFKFPDGTNRQFTVRFLSGMATVPSNIGQYLVDKGVAQKSPIIGAEIAARVLLQDERVRNHRIITSEYHNGA